MALQIIWSDLADESIYELTNFLADSWDQQVVNRFVDKIYDTVSSLATFPEMGRITNEQLGVRSFVVKPYARIFYSVLPNAIYIHRVIDTRQNPNR